MPNAQLSVASGHLVSDSVIDVQSYDIRSEAWGNPTSMSYSDRPYLLTCDCTIDPSEYWTISKVGDGDVYLEDSYYYLTTAQSGEASIKKELLENQDLFSIVIKFRAVALNINEPTSYNSGGFRLAYYSGTKCVYIIWTEGKISIVNGATGVNVVSTDCYPTEMPEYRIDFDKVNHVVTVYRDGEEILSDSTVWITDATNENNILLGVKGWGSEITSVVNIDYIYGFRGYKFSGYASDGFKYTNGVKDSPDDIASWQNISGVFPTVAFLILSSGGLDIIDAQDNSLWMRFETGSDYVLDGGMKCISAANGVISIGTETGGIRIIDMRNDAFFVIGTSEQESTTSDFSERNDTISWSSYNDVTVGNAHIRCIHMRIYDNIEYIAAGNVYVDLITNDRTTGNNYSSKNNLYTPISGDAHIDAIHLSGGFDILKVDAAMLPIMIIALGGDTAAEHRDLNIIWYKHAYDTISADNFTMTYLEHMGAYQKIGWLPANVGKFYVHKICTIENLYNSIGALLSTDQGVILLELNHACSHGEHYGPYIYSDAPNRTFPWNEWNVSYYIVPTRGVITFDIDTQYSDRDRKLRLGHHLWPQATHFSTVFELRWYGSGADEKNDYMRIYHKISDGTTRYWNATSGTWVDSEPAYNDWVFYNGGDRIVVKITYSDTTFKIAIYQSDGITLIEESSELTLTSETDKALVMPRSITYRMIGAGIILKNYDVTVTDSELCGDIDGDNPVASVVSDNARFTNMRRVLPNTTDTQALWRFDGARYVSDSDKYFYTIHDQSGNSLDLTLSSSSSVKQISKTRHGMGGICFQEEWIIPSGYSIPSSGSIEWIGRRASNIANDSTEQLLTLFRLGSKAVNIYCLMPFGTVETSLTGHSTLIGHRVYVIYYKDNSNFEVLNTHRLYNGGIFRNGTESYGYGLMYIVVTWDSSGDIKLYHNGRLVDSTSISSIGALNSTGGALGHCIKTDYCPTNVIGESSYVKKMPYQVRLSNTIMSADNVRSRWSELHSRNGIIGVATTGTDAGVCLFNWNAMSFLRQYNDASTPALSSTSLVDIDGDVL